VKEAGALVRYDGGVKVKLDCAAKMTGAEDSSARETRGARPWARDLMGAIALVEGAIAQRVFSGIDGLELTAQNAFGEPVAVEFGADVADLARRCARAAEQGERVALVARASDLARARSELASIAASRLGIVVHALTEPARGGAFSSISSMAGLAPALALDDLFWGMLLGAGVSDAIDLALVARRAAEDSGCPFFVVHERSHAHDVEPISAPSRELCDAFVGPARGRVRRATATEDPTGGSGDRAFAERAPFALGSAMRELEALTGRHHDVIERVPASDAAVALVGAGALGDSLLADIERLRAGGHDVAGVRVVAWRPFPAPRLVKALGRALAVTVLERVDRPLASGAPLAVQLKAAFADALTWAPDYPGVGRIPRIVSGILAPEREVDSTDLDAIVHNVLADERGKRAFVLGGEDAHALRASPAAQVHPVASSAGTFVMRGIAGGYEVAAAAAELSAAVLASALGLRTRVAVRGLSDEEGGGVAFDLAAGRKRPRGSHAPYALDLVAVSDPAFLARGNALARLAPAGVVAMPSDRRGAEALWAEVPPWVKALVFDRGARLVGWSPPALRGADEAGEASKGDEFGTWLAASAFVGIALAVAASDRELGVGAGIDGAVVQREVAEALRFGVAFGARDGALVADRGASVARAVFEATVEVPRATIEREDDGVRLGRRPRAPGAPGQ
jgi:pyruvate ferredoxin oxidoreductase alpha subunit